MSAVVAVPVYRPHPLPYEAFALERACALLNEHSLVLFAPAGFDRTPYARLAPSARWEEFDETYFQGTHTYNALCLSASFYQRFEAYEHLLICQLDALVLGGDLESWCSQPFDFVGGAVAWRDPHSGEFVRWTRSQNGGLSLRNVAAHLRVLSSPNRIGGAELTAHERAMHREMGGYSAAQHSSFLWNLRFAARTRVEQARTANSSCTLAEYLARCGEGNLLAEDQFWSRMAQVFEPSFRVASLAAAQKFSIQNGLDLTAPELVRSPPFGCHGPEITQTVFEFACRERTPQTNSEIHLWNIAHAVGLVPALDSLPDSLKTKDVTTSGVVASYR